jgi:hypothetical protein
MEDGMSTKALMRACLERGVRFSLNGDAGVLLAGDEVLARETVAELEDRVSEIADALRLERHRKVSAGDVAVHLAAAIVRGCASAEVI